MKRFKQYLLDMDGTIYLGGRAIDGAAEAVEKMRRNGKVFFLTNNTSASRDFYVQKLHALGFTATKEEIFTAGNAAAVYIKNHYADAKVFLLGTPSLCREFEEYGITLEEESPDLAVVGFDTTLTYGKLAKLCGFIRRGIPYIATHPDINCPTADGYIPDVGSITALIEASTGRKPDCVCGKPNAVMARAVEALTGAKGKDVAMIGDRLYTDMRFAADNGFYSVLVLSGEATKADLDASGIKVDRVVRSVAEFAE